MRGTKFLSHFNLVESLAIHADDRALRHEGLRVNVLDEPEDDGGFAFLGQYEQHPDLAARIEARCVDDRHATVGELVDMLADLLILVADDEELHRLACAVDYLVQDEAGDEQRHVAIDHLFPIVQYQVAGRDDGQVHDAHHLSQRDVAVLMHHGGDDIRAARATVVGEGNADAASAECRSQHASHERLVVQQLHALGQLLDDGQESG